MLSYLNIVAFYVKKSEVVFRIPTTVGKTPLFLLSIPYLFKLLPFSFMVLGIINNPMSLMCYFTWYQLVQCLSVPACHNIGPQNFEETQQQLYLLVIYMGGIGYDFIKICLLVGTVKYFDSLVGSFQCLTLFKNI